MDRIAISAAIMAATFLLTPTSALGADARATPVPAADEAGATGPVGPPRMVGAPGDVSASALPVGYTHIAIVGDEAWFVTAGGARPGELWRTDGTEAGTLLVTDRFATERDDPITQLTAVGDELWFAAEDRNHGNELWRSDGTAKGTRLVADLATGDGNAYPQHIVPLEDAVLFWTTGRDATCGLWHTDGTPEGTTFIRRAGCSGPAAAVRLGDAVVWFDTRQRRQVVWRSDGTTMGTWLVRAFRRVAETDRVVTHDGVAYFAADDRARGSELWRTDGTRAGTRLVADAMRGKAGSSPEPLAVVDGSAYFLARAPQGGRALWRTDGSRDGTSVVASLSGMTPYDFAAGDHMLYFWARDKHHGSELWVSDGTPDGTRMVRDIATGRASSGPTGYGEIAVLGDRAVFAARGGRRGSELWVSDGTRSGTRMIADIEPGRGGRGPSWPIRMGDIVLFSADDATHGRELWRTDGTAEGTWLVGDIGRRMADVSAYDVASVGGDLAFIGGVRGRGGLWWIDASSGKGRFLARVSGGDYGVYVDALDEGVVFTGTTDRTGVEPWISDGAKAGTRMLKQVHRGRDPLIGTGGGTYPAGSYPGPATSVGGVGYFAARDQQHGFELWRTDGTGAGTRLLKDIRPGAAGSMSESDRRLTLAGGRLYFVADDGRHGAELWRSDGTAAGTRMVKDIRPGSRPGSSLQWSSDLVAVGDLVYFAADDGTHGRELWRTDGTTTGTRRVADVHPGRGSSKPDDLAAVDDTLYFVAYDGTHGRELWRTDGSADGTTLVADLAPGRKGSLLGELVELGDELIFTRWDGPGELVIPGTMYRTDGTQGGTQPVDRSRDGLTLRRYWSEFPATVVVGQRLFFAADDGVHGVELWVTDGTQAGTLLVADLRPGPEGSDPQWGVAADGYLYVSADDGVHGRQWWQVPLVAT